MTELEILSKISSGGDDRERGFEALYYKKAAELKRRFQWLGVPPSDCDDVLQEVVLRVLRGADGFCNSNRQALSDNGAAVWINVVARNCVNDYFRGKKREVETVNIEADICSRGVDVRGSLDEKLNIGDYVDDNSQRLREIELEICIDNLVEKMAETEPDRARALMMKLNGESIAAIAEVIGRTVAATKQFLSQTRKKYEAGLSLCWDLRKDSV